MTSRDDTKYALNFEEEWTVLVEQTVTMVASKDKIPYEKQHVIIMPCSKRGETNKYKFLSLVDILESYECTVPNAAMEDEAVEVNSVQVILDYKMHTLDTADVNTVLAV
eukprot:3577675-Ditylum_brightwellii.AAC.1